jgi:hypothetical protein
VLTGFPAALVACGPVARLGLVALLQDDVCSPTIEQDDAGSRRPEDEPTEQNLDRHPIHVLAGTVKRVSR